MTLEEIVQGSCLPRLEAEVLAAAALGRERTWVLAHGEVRLTPQEEDRVQAALHRRAAGEPLAYITGVREFYGRTFAVTPAVLIPRPATEHLVDLAREWLTSPRNDVREADRGIVVVSRVLRPEISPCVVVDCGTGSGCIAVTLAIAMPHLRVIATDVSDAALTIAHRNAATFGVAERVHCVLGEGLAPVRGLREPFLLVTNPPYVPLPALISREVSAYEPAAALFAGEDGLRILRPLLAEAVAHPQCAGIIFECQEDQLKVLGIVENQSSGGDHGRTPNSSKRIRR